jgi:hypothetical protein
MNSRERERERDKDNNVWMKMIEGDAHRFSDFVFFGLTKGVE